MTKYMINNEQSINHIDNKDFLNDMIKKGVVAVDNNAPMVSTPNINVPAGALQYIMPSDIEIRTAPLVADRIASKQKIGDFGGTRSIVFKIKEFLGRATADDGRANDSTRSTVNYSTITRGAFAYSTYWNTTDLMETSVGAMGQNYQRDSIASAMNTLAMMQNQIFFDGVEDKNLNEVGVSYPVYGLLNEPSLIQYNTVSKNQGGTSTNWEDKTAQEIYNDILKAKVELTNRTMGLAGQIITSGLASGRGKLKLAIATGSFELLNRVEANSVNSKTARELLKENMGIEDNDLISVPQFNSAKDNSDVFYLIYEDKAVYGDTIINAYQELIRAYPIFQHHSEYSQKLSSQVSGCIVQYPMFITRYKGIGKSPKADKVILA